MTELPPAHITIPGESDIDRARRIHVDSGGPGGLCLGCWSYCDHCESDEHTWPCDVAKVLAVLDRVSAHSKAVRLIVEAAWGDNE